MGSLLQACPYQLRPIIHLHAYYGYGFGSLSEESTMWTLPTSIDSLTCEILPEQFFVCLFVCFLFYIFNIDEYLMAIGNIFKSPAGKCPEDTRKSEKYRKLPEPVYSWLVECSRGCDWLKAEWLPMIGQLPTETDYSCIYYYIICFLVQTYRLFTHIKRPRGLYPFAWPHIKTKSQIHS